MIEPTPVMLVWLLAWGTLLGLDMVSLPQMMISRPLVAGAVAGWSLGDPAFGITTGLVLELFALESLAIGAARYPDYGAAAVGAVVAGAGYPWVQSLGVAVTIGLVQTTCNSRAAGLYPAGKVKMAVAILPFFTSPLRCTTPWLSLKYPASLYVPP